MSFIFLDYFFRIGWAGKTGDDDLEGGAAGAQPGACRSRGSEHARPGKQRPCNSIQSDGGSGHGAAPGSGKGMDAMKEGLQSHALRVTSRMEQMGGRTGRPGTRTEEAWFECERA